MASSFNKSSPLNQSQSSLNSNRTTKSTLPAWTNLFTIPEGRPCNLFVGGQDQDHDDADWVWLDDEEVVAMVDEQMAKKIEKVVTLKDNHFPSFNNNKIKKNNFKSDEHKGFVSLSELCLPMDGYEFITKKTLLGSEKFKLGNSNEEQNPNSAASVSILAPNEFQEHYEMMESKVCGQMSSSTWENQSFMD